MARRRRKYGWLYHSERMAWMPPDGQYEASQADDGSWVVWRLPAPYATRGARIIFEDCDTLEEAVGMAETDRQEA